MRSRRKGKSPSHQLSNERWLVSYADFMTLLFAFFVVLFATSERSLEKAQEFQESINRYLIKAGAFGGSGGQINQGEKNDQVIETPLPTYKSNRPQDAEMTAAAEQAVEKEIDQEDRKKYLIDLFADDLGVRIVVRGSLIFPNGEDRFKREALPFLSRMAQIFKKIDQRILIQSHLDESASTSNLEEFSLGQKRVLQIARYLSKVHHFPVQRMTLASLGSNKPLSENRKELNDRLEFIVLFEDISL